MNNEDIPESAKMEEGMMASTGVPTTTETSMYSSAASSTNKRLSTVSKMYDTSGKGELDSVQLASKLIHVTVPCVVFDINLSATVLTRPLHFIRLSLS